MIEVGEDSKEASKTPDKDKMRCHYCQEKGHFAQECKKRIRDKEQAAQFNLFTKPEEQEEQFSNDELDIDNNNSAELNYYWD